MEKRNIIAYIPVRGGSKGIPGKNIKLIGGRPLVHWTMLAALGAKHINKVVVATDCDQIASVASSLQSPKLEIFRRNHENCSDTASTESAMLEYASQKSDFTHMILIQATSPLLESCHLDAAIEQCFKSGADSMLSVVRQFRFIWKQTEDGYVEPVNYDPLNRPRRQDFDGMLVENGAFYMSSKERILKTKCRISGKIIGYELPEDLYVEIDSVDDWKIVDGIICKRTETAEQKA